ncbi:MAG: protein kinase domain-containing protein [Betaproteobacteria bacterium]
MELAATSDRHFEDTLPPRIGKYHILRELGRGATSRVFLADDSFFARRVAIKMIDHEASVDPRLRSRFQRVFMNEAALAGKLSHPHNVAIHDAVSEDELSYVVMEYVPGHTLRRYCSPESLLPMEQVVEIGFKASQALDYAGRQGVIHCDVKPANILLTAGTEIKVSDFGAARYDHAEHTCLSGIGSPAYMSPEQVLEKPLTQQTDIYSLGVVLYQLLTGRLPFEGSNRNSLAYQIAHIDPVPPSVHRRDLPEPLERIVLQALSKDLSSRYPVWNEVSRDLARAFKHLRLPDNAVPEAEHFGILRGLPFFRDFLDVELWETMRLARWQSHGAGSVILREGEISDGFFVLASGEALACRNCKTLESMQAGHCFGHMLYFEEGVAPRGTTILSRGNCLVMEVKAQGLREASERTQMKFNRAFLRVLVNRINRSGAQTGATTEGGAAAPSAPEASSHQ